ncbi:hypothetical protein ACFLYU_00260 [Candidatus Dependentiae bacterium]
MKKTIWCFMPLVLICSTINTYQFTKITVLSAPIGKNNTPAGRGPTVVRTNLLKGLKKLGVNFNYNPKQIREVGDVLVVLSNIHALKQAIQLKRQGIIKKLLAGPNLMVRSIDHNKILNAPELDMYMVNSDWTFISYLEDLPSLKERLTIWPAGVDPEYWKPSKNNLKNKNVLVYVKKTGDKLAPKIKEILEKYDWNPIEIVYGKYNPKQFKEALSKCHFAVFLSLAESQGIALAESWSMGVPTLPWNCRYLNAHGKIYTSVSSCPYLNDQLGLDWKNIDEFESLIQNIETKLNNFSPRRWVLENMTCEISAKIMLDIIESL